MTDSPATLIAQRLVRSLGRDGAHRAIDLMIDSMQVVDAAALAYDWSIWARPKQVPPSTAWRSWGFLCGRGFGKSRSVAELVQGEVEAGRARSVGMSAQNEEKTDELAKVLIETAPPWFRPEHRVTDKMLVWPNGAKAFLRTPEAPGAIRSENHDLSWLSELQSWPVAQREEAYKNFRFATRIGYARMVWDATPKKGHPILKRLLKRGVEQPDLHVIVRGTMYENAMNLGAGIVQDLEGEFGGTSAGREELLGEMLDETDGALVKQKWIDDARRPMPPTCERRIICADPATTSRAGSDKTGLVDLGLGADGQLYICGNHTAKMRATEWIDLALKLYVVGRCDLLLIETNKGGDLLFDVIALEAQKRGLTAVRVGKNERPRHQPGIVNVREVYGQGPKEDRAQPMATAYERGRVSHVIGADLAELEEWLTTWEPEKGMRSPDAIDALAHGAVELLGASLLATRAAAGFRGLTEMGQALTRPARVPGGISMLIGGGTGGRI